jgi:hypothetical protein
MGKRVRVSLEETTAMMKNLQVKNGPGYVAARIPRAEKFDG